MKVDDTPYRALRKIQLSEHNFEVERGFIWENGYLEQLSGRKYDDFRMV